MGTNYYMTTDVCTHCHRQNEKHLGKTSAGSNFIWQETDEWHTYELIMEALRNESQGIYDEYGNSFTMEEFLFKVLEHNNDAPMQTGEWS